QDTLAGAALSRNQNRRIGGCHPVRDRAHVLHRRRFSLDLNWGGMAQKRIFSLASTAIAHRPAPLHMAACAGWYTRILPTPLDDCGRRLTALHSPSAARADRVYRCASAGPRDPPTAWRSSPWLAVGDQSGAKAQTDAPLRPGRWYRGWSGDLSAPRGRKPL